MNLNLEILDSFVDSIAVINSKGEIVFTNRAWKDFAASNEGDPHKTGSGVNYLELCRKVNGEELLDAKQAAIGIRDVIEGKSKLFEMEYPCHSHDQQRWFIMRVSAVENDPSHTLISHINITRRKLAEEKLRLANETLNTTMYRIVHDIQGPLRSIEGLIHISNMKKNDPEKDPHLGMISKSVDKLKNFIQETLAHSLSGSKAEAIDFNELIKSYLDSIKYHEALKTVNLRVKVKQPVSFFAIRSEVNSIISNLVSNSLKYYDPVKQDKFVEISVNVTEKEAEISVHDNGIGISKDALPRIFDLHFQQNRNAGSGAGVGLHIVARSLESVHGKINVESRLGEGTRFTVMIPNS